jgi:hypothetical protein
MKRIINFKNGIQGIYLDKVELSMQKAHEIVICADKMMHNMVDYSNQFLPVADIMARSEEERKYLCNIAVHNACYQNTNDITEFGKLENEVNEFISNSTAPFNNNIEILKKILHLSFDAEIDDNLKGYHVQRAGNERSVKEVKKVIKEFNIPFKFQDDNVQHQLHVTLYEGFVLGNKGFDSYSGISDKLGDVINDKKDKFAEFGDNTNVEFLNEFRFCNGFGERLIEQIVNHTDLASYENKESLFTPDLIALESDL